MPFKTTAFALLALFALVNCIHLQHHFAFNHQLKLLQASLLTKADAIKLQLENASSKVQSQTNLDKKIQLLENVLTQQRTNILELIKISEFDLNETKWTCEALGPMQIQGLKSHQRQIKTSISNLTSVINSKLGKWDDFKSTAILMNSVNQHVSAQQSAFNSVGKDELGNLNLVKTTNYNAGFWALGKKTIKSYQEQLNDQTGKFFEFCPYYKPFADRQGNCIQCPLTLPYFLVSEKVCLSCPHYSLTNRQCVDSKGGIKNANFFTNFEAGKGKILLLGNQSLSQFNNNYYGLPLCPIQTPFYNSTACINCPPSLYFSVADLICRTCPSNQYFDLLTSTCKQQFYYSKTSSHSWTTSRPVQDILESISLKKSQLQYAQCPADKPFGNETDCFSCASPTHFSYDSLKCQACPKGTILNLNMHKCLAPENLNYQTNPNSKNLIYNGKSENEWMSVYYQNIQKNNGIADCPSSNPYFDGIACISCPRSSPYFNLDSLICQQCEGTTLYSAHSKECLSTDSNRAVQTPSWQKMAAAVLT